MLDIPKKLDTYPEKQLYTKGQTMLLPAPKTETFLKKLSINVGKATATTVLNSLNTKGGAPEFEIDDNNNQGNKNGKFSKSSNSNGRRKTRSDKTGNSKPGRGGSGSRSINSGGTRGYQYIPGTACLIWSSGIRSGLTVNTRITTEDYTPLYLSSGWLFKITNSEIDPNTYYNSERSNIIYPLIEGVISNRINRYAGRYINVGKFNKYFDALTEALQIYYCIDNVLTYRSNISLENVNVGMETLSSKLSATAVVEFNLLKEMLSTCCCPVRMLDYIRFMCQSYRSSDAPHSSILKLNIGGMFDDNWTSGTSQHIENLIRDARFSLVKANEMNSYLIQCFPEWLIGNPPASSWEACYDKNFMLFWHNQNCCYLSSDSTRKKQNLFDYTQEINSIDQYIDYQIISKDEMVDGVIFVSNSYLIKESGVKTVNCYWGIWHPLASVNEKTILSGNSSDSFNIKCLDQYGKIKPVINSTVLGSSGIHFLVEYTGELGSKIPQKIQFGTHGFVKLQNVSVRMQNEAFNNTMRFLYL